MSDFCYSCYCYSCCFWVFVLLLDCCCFPPKLSFIVRTRAAMCWFFWILFGYSPSANEGPSKVLKSWCQIQWCWKPKSRGVGREHIHTLHVPTPTDIWITTCVQLPVFMQIHVYVWANIEGMCRSDTPQGNVGLHFLLKDTFHQLAERFHRSKDEESF